MKKIVLFGDSLFNGFVNHQNTEIVTKNLKMALGKSYQVINLSQSGACSLEALEFLPKIPQDSRLVLIEYGTNDASVIGIKSSDFEKNLEKIINFVSPKKAIIVSPWQEKSNYHYLIKENLKRNYQISQKLAQKYHCPFIDLTLIRKNATDLDSLYQADSLHLSQLGNQKLISLLATAIKKASL